MSANLIIWTGTAEEYRSMLAAKEAELRQAISEISDNPETDWYVINRIAALEPQIADLKRWLKETEGK